MSLDNTGSGKTRILPAMNTTRERNPNLLRLTDISTLELQRLLQVQEHAVGPDSGFARLLRRVITRRQQCEKEGDNDGK